MKHALVTGGANGIGRGIVAHLLDLGWAVHALDRDADGLADLPDHDHLTRVEADVSDEASVRSALAGLKRLDLLVSNAGIASPDSGPVEDLSLEDWNAWIGTNLTGSFLMAKHTVPLLRAANGSMILMSSTRAFMSEPNTEAYAATKGGLVALTHALAVSLGPAVRVNGIAPGWIVTGDFDALRDVDHTQHPAGRAGKPSDIARAVEYLAGSEFTTGQILTIDGGMTRKMIYAE
ncbi:NAD(P)-dependent dehydrogenase, short-chain alcohol dehydrogenase family [Palleronia marisminoris]|uniref:3-oxoacyl-[acyl-carrier-protein] reductase FabG n=1 Tax=Palleronia marisminoris TaxID=315423 RepID=A0A1Y5RIP6_9RHOB|nr:SDR family oxidoreductase [Palleronia marisminoris]SFG23636.1 NAD(P)-dependent dehydrogenase, short-chain alcohol dehydrogenase family [Palleronia marisminoris]SLN18562.1 3-oxoacyl-[acyl-carrier-protein] reductase FabG [Palleronia marisminoris]